MGDVTLPLSKLMLDEQNPRHRPVTTQDAALAEVFRRGPIKLLNLARDIAATGLSPIDRPVVLKATGSSKYIMLEGNRRLAAMRLLNKPELCPDASLASKFEEAAKTAAVKIKTVRCYEVNSRDEARPLLDRRHGGEMDGIGVVRWSAMQRTRNAEAPAHQEKVALITLDWLDGKAAAGANQGLADLLDEVAEGKFTTFGRLVGDPDFRSYAGFDIKGDIFTSIDSNEKTVVRLTLVLQDFQSSDGSQALTVTELKTKRNRADYIAKLRKRVAGADEADEEESDGEPESSGATSHGQPDGGGSEGTGTGGDGATGGESKPAEPTQPKPKPQPTRLFLGASLANCSARVRNILDEVQKIPIERYPNSAAACIRMVIELAVMEAHEKAGWPTPPEKDKNLRAYVNNALKQLDPGGKAQQYLNLRQEINKKDSIINTVTLNAFLHSPHYSPSGPTMRAISDTYTTLLNGVDQAISDAKESKP